MQPSGRWFLLFLCACAACPMPASSAIRVLDERPAEVMKGRRDSNFSAIAFLPEKAIKPGPVAQLQVALEARHPMVDGELRIQELSVVDIFIKRMRTVLPGNALFSLLIDRKTDWNFVRENDIPQDEDSILCVLRATYDGRDVRASAVVPYKLPLSAMMVRSNVKFREAVTACIDQLAANVSP